MRSAALAVRHYLRPLGRTALGASCGLYGNGMVFRSEVLRGYRWTDHLTEDAELQMELLVRGQLVDFAPDAVIEAEMPHTLDAARTQNERWELGRAQIARRFVPTLARRAVSPAASHRVACADAVADHLVPPLSVVAAAAVGAASLGQAARWLSPARATRRVASLGVVTCLALGAHVLSALRMVGAPRSVYLALLQAPRMVMWKVALWVRVLARPAEVRWVRTARNPDGVDGLCVPDASHA